MEEWLAESGLYYEVSKYDRFSMIHTAKSGVKIDVFRTESTRRQWIEPNEARMFLDAFRCFLEQFRPDVLLTYGGDSVTLAMMRLAKSGGVPIVFLLKNFAYAETSTFDQVDSVIVPSEFSRRHYLEKLGLKCHRIPNVIDFEQVSVERRQEAFVTFVNPQPAKGLFWFMGIALELARSRPDIPLLVVEGRTGGNRLGSLPNVRVMPNTSDPREFYRVSRMMLMPSVCTEAFGLVAAESMVNGIPVLASDRGALPEVIGDGGRILNIPAWFTEASTEIPNAEVVRPWVRDIVRLWDDRDEYADLSAKGKRRAMRYHRDELGPRFERFFREVAGKAP